MSSFFPSNLVILINILSLKLTVTLMLCEQSRGKIDVGRGLGSDWIRDEKCRCTTKMIDQCLVDALWTELTTEVEKEEAQSECKESAEKWISYLQQKYKLNQKSKRVKPCKLITCCLGLAQWWNYLLVASAFVKYRNYVFRFWRFMELLLNQPNLLQHRLFSYVNSSAILAF